MQIRNELQQSYADTLIDSAFILCPRGIAPSTVRLFEAMRSGRAPVIISDEWSPPDGPNWAAFSIRVPESEVANLPALLAPHEHRAAEMGRCARHAWEEWFSPEVGFHRIVEWCLDIQRQRYLPESVLRFTAYWQLLHPPYRAQYFQNHSLWKTASALRNRLR